MRSSSKCLVWIPYAKNVDNHAFWFRDIVDAAHLRPITKQDKANAKTKNRLWNSAASETSN